MRTTLAPPSALILLVVGLLGCPPSRNDDPDACEDGGGTLRVCATYFEGLAQGYANVRTDAEDDAPLSALLDETGCADIQLDAGDYQWQSEALSDTCISDWVDVTIEDCEVTEVSIELGDYCFDGR